MNGSNVLEHLSSTSAESREREMAFARKHAVDTIEANKEIILRCKRLLWSRKKLRAEAKESRRVGTKSKIIAEISKHGGGWTTEKELKLSTVT